MARRSRRWPGPAIARAGAALIALAVFGLWSWYDARNNGPEYRVAKVERGNLTATVSASGTLSAVTTVQGSHNEDGGLMACRVRRLRADCGLAAGVSGSA